MVIVSIVSGFPSHDSVGSQCMLSKIPGVPRRFGVSLAYTEQRARAQFRILCRRGRILEMKS